MKENETKWSAGAMLRDRRLWSFGRMVAAAIIAASIIVADYFVANMQYPLLDNTLSLTLMELPALNRQGAGRSLTDSLYMVSTSVDRQLTPVVRDGDTIGHTAITDRTALLRFLQATEHADYSFMFMDIRFEPGMDTPADSALFGQMLRMKRFAFAMHNDADSAGRLLLPADSLEAVAAMSDFRYMVFGNFSRYEMVQDGRESAALKMFKALDHGDIERLGYVWTARDAKGGRRLCNNMVFVPLPAGLADDSPVAVKTDGRKYGVEHPYLYLSADVLAPNTPAEIARFVSGKTVLIGDFDGDRHLTYVGEIPGPLIHYYAYRALSDGCHHYDVAVNGILALLYMAIAYWLLLPVSVTRPLRVMTFAKSAVSRSVLSLIGWELFFLMVKAVVYYLSGQLFVAFVPSTTFAIITLIRNILQKHNDNRPRRSQPSNQPITPEP